MSAPEKSALGATRSTDDDSTGLPALRTWPAVYAAVLVVFAGWVALLSWLSVAFA